MVTWGGTTVLGNSAAAPGTPAKSPAPGGGFSFGGPPTPAPAAAGGGLFGSGAPATPGSATPGAPVKSPAAASPAGGFSFGGGAAPAPAPPGGGLFGAPAPSPAGGGLFGAPAPAPAGGGLFGAPAPAHAGGGLFGSPAPAAGGPFGAPAPAPGAFGGFGAAPPAAAHAPHHTPHQAAYAAHALAIRRQEAARLESAVVGLHSAYSPTSVDPLHLQPRSPLHATQPSSLCRFRHIFYDPIGPEERQLRMVHGPHHQPARPAHVDAQTWSEAVARNPDPDQFVPVCVVGADALASRLAAQQERARTLAGYVSKLIETVASLRVSLGKSSDSVRAGLAERDALRKRTLELMRRVEIVRCMNLPLQLAEHDANLQVRELVRAADATGRALGEAEERGRAHARRLRAMAASAPSSAEGSGELDLSDRNREELHRVLREQGEGIAALGNIASRDLRDAAILREEVARIERGGVPGVTQAAGTHPAFAGGGLRR